MLPVVKLPIKLDIVRHVRESRTKSTALHALVLGERESVRIAETPDLDALEVFDPARTVLLYPSKTSVTLADMGDALKDVDRVVVVDSTWQQAASVLRSPQLRGLKHVKLQASYNTSFWRYQQVRFSTCGQSGQPPKASKRQLTNGPSVAEGRRIPRHD